MQQVQPFKAPEYTQFSNDALDSLMCKVSANCWKIICVAIRKTYGWHKKTDRISFSQFKEATGISSSTTISKAISEALGLGIFKRKAAGQGFTYSLNLEFSCSTESGPVQKMDRSRKWTGTSPENGQVEPKTSPENGHTKESFKEIKETTRKSAAVNKPDSFSQEEWEDLKAHRKAKKAPLTPRALSGLLSEFKKSGMPPGDCITEMATRGWAGFKAEWVNKQPQQAKGEWS